MGLRFVFDNFEARRGLLQFLSRWKARSAAQHAVSEQTLARKRALRAARPAYRQGQALAEFCLIFPLLFLLIVNVVNFGAFMYDWITVANAARAAVQYWVTGGQTVFAPTTPAEATVKALITTDTSSLPNTSSLKVKACTFYNPTGGSGTGTLTCSGDTLTITNPPNDPEYAKYVTASVDVQYTYQPVIPLWQFPSLNIYVTLPSNTNIHRQAVMRVMQ